MVCKASPSSRLHPTFRKPREIGVGLVHGGGIKVVVRAVNGAELERHDYSPVQSLRLTQAWHRSDGALMIVYDHRVMVEGPHAIFLKACSRLSAAPQTAWAEHHLLSRSGSIAREKTPPPLTG